MTNRDVTADLEAVMEAAAAYAQMPVDIRPSIAWQIIAVADKVKHMKTLLGIAKCPNDCPSPLVPGSPAPCQWCYETGILLRGL